MAPVRTDEGPGAHREAEDIAGAERTRLGKRDFARWGRSDDAVRDAICRFSGQLITRESVGARRAGDREDLVLQREFRLARDFIFVRAETVGSLEIRRHAYERRALGGFLELDGHGDGTVHVLVDHLDRAGLAKRPVAP